MLFLNTTPDFNRLGYEFHSSTWAIPGVISGHTKGTDAQKPTVLSTCSPVTDFTGFSATVQTWPALIMSLWIYSQLSQGYHRLATACYTDWRVNHGKSSATQNTSLFCFCFFSLSLCVVISTMVFLLQKLALAICKYLCSPWVQTLPV